MNATSRRFARDWQKAEKRDRSSFVAMKAETNRFVRLIARSPWSGIQTSTKKVPVNPEWNEC